MNTEDIIARLEKTEHYFSNSSLTVDKMAAEDLRDAIAEITRLRSSYQAALLASEYGWTIIANVSQGDWAKQSTEWSKAAAIFRDSYYYPVLRHSLSRDGGGVDPPEPVPKPKPDETASED